MNFKEFLILEKNKNILIEKFYVAAMGNNVKLKINLGNATTVESIIKFFKNQMNGITLKDIDSFVIDPRDNKASMKVNVILDRHLDFNTMVSIIKDAAKKSGFQISTVG